jgi:hypothetical protein
MGDQNADRADLLQLDAVVMIIVMSVCSNWNSEGYALCVIEQIQNARADRRGEGYIYIYVFIYVEL